MSATIIELPVRPAPPDRGCQVCMTVEATHRLVSWGLDSRDEAVQIEVCAACICPPQKGQVTMLVCLAEPALDTP